MQDEFLKRLAEDTVLYVRTVCNTIIMEVPKAIVHCQVSSIHTHLYLTKQDMRGSAQGLVCHDTRVGLVQACSSQSNLETSDRLGQHFSASARSHQQQNTAKKNTAKNAAKNTAKHVQH